MPYLAIFRRLILRPLRAEPTRTSLTVLAVALGVAVVLAIELAGDAAAGSFRSSVETMTGRADFEITGSAGGLAPDILRRLALLPESITLQPRIEDYAVVNKRTVPFIGVETFQDGVRVSPSLGWKTGETATLLLNDSAVQVRVDGLLPESAGEAVVADLATATKWLRRDGSLDRILVEIPRGADPARYQKILVDALGSGATVQPFGARTAENRRMLEGFRWNLRVLSWIALVVGAFLIYNTISVSVVRRRAEIGVLRALGVTRGGVLAAFLGESACFGLIGGALGVLLGRVLAESAVGLISTTVESLYVSSRPGTIVLSTTLASFGLLAGLAVAVLSAVLPAWEASQVPPVEAMSRGRAEHGARLRVRSNLLIAGLLLVVAGIASRQAPVAGKPLFGYLSALCLIGALAAGIGPLIGFASQTTAGAIRKVFGVEGLLAIRSLRGSLRRTSVLAGALATAIAMTAAVGIMVGSFRETVLRWMTDRLEADVYLRPAGPASADRFPTMAPDTAALLRALPEVARVDEFRGYRITYDGTPATILSRPNVQTATVTEPFAAKHNIRKGDRISVRLGSQDVKFEVRDIVADYASEQGYIIISRETLLHYLPDPAPSSLALHLKPGVSVEQGRDAVQRALADRRVLVFSNRKLREEAIKTFDRTFAITYALEGIAVLVAVMGVAGALLALVIDRRRELGLLRFLGGAAGQIRRLILFEAGLLGLLSTVAGLALGVLLSLLLIYVINKQSFGWTIQFHWPVAMLISALGAVFLATVASAIYPARVAARLNPIEVIHEE